MTSAGSTAVVLFTRALRVHDHPALAEAHRAAERVVPLFVFDDAVVDARFASANRVQFLLDALADLRSSLRRKGTDLVVRRGDPVACVIDVAREVGAGAVFATGDVTGYARRRQDRLAAACRSHRLRYSEWEGVTVVPPEALEPSGADHYRVFTPYWRAWRQATRRPVAVTPRRLRLPDGIDCGRLPDRAELVSGTPSPELPQGGERLGRAQVDSWVRHSLEGYERGHDDLAGGATSRLSPFLHFGCVSALEVVRRVADRSGAEPFVRQLCWRDFHHQVTAAFPAIATTDYRSRNDRWRHDPDALAAWMDGRTGYPIVDAGMRQLAREGWMHNRARLIVASFLTKDLYLDWRLGAAHFLDLLVDGDIANNSGNWQWVAGTGNDTRPNRMFNPLRQAARFDPDGAFVRRYLPELAGLDGTAVHTPWRLPSDQRRRIDYPDPIVDHDLAAAAFHEHRG